jgi:hypothetical protein
MTPEEKAKELVDKFSKATDEDGYINLNKFRHKQCALIAVDEILKEIDDCFLQRYDAVDRYYYYKEVKQEIKKL